MIRISNYTHTRARTPTHIPRAHVHTHTHIPRTYAHVHAHTHNMAWAVFGSIIYKDVQNKQTQYRHKEQNDVL